jgi:hypothetical protein
VTLGGAKAIKEHPFFTQATPPFDWDSLYNRRMTPPIVPSVRAASDLSNFDHMVTTLTVFFLWSLN